jgi:hypothetical protein
MPKVFFFLILLTASQCVFSQNLKKLGTISFLNAKAKEAIGSVRIFTNSRTVIEDASISESEMGLLIFVKLSSVGKEDATITSEFDPSDIESVEIVSVEKKSPVGQVKITLKDATKKSVTNSKSDGQVTIYEELVYFNYLNVEKSNAERIKQAFLDLKDFYRQRADQAIDELADRIPAGKNFWIGMDGGTSITYRPDEIYADGCTLRIFFRQETVTKYGDDNKYHLVEIPLNAIGSISMSSKKSKPNCIILHADKKKSFDLYNYTRVASNEVYKNKSSIREFPLPIDVTFPENNKEIKELLKKLIKDCGGKKIKI